MPIANCLTASIAVYYLPSNNPKAEAPPSVERAPHRTMTPTGSRQLYDAYTPNSEAIDPDDAAAATAAVAAARAAATASRSIAGYPHDVLYSAYSVASRPVELQF